MARCACGSSRARRIAAIPARLTPADVESVAGCDIFLKREGAQFRGGTRGRKCLEHGWRRAALARLSRGDRRWPVLVSQAPPDLARRRARRGDRRFPARGSRRGAAVLLRHLLGASREKAPRKLIDSVDLHDRGGRARFRTPDGRELQLELHGRDWPLSEGRESLVLILTDGKADSEPIASSWTSLGAARVGHRHRLAGDRLRAGGFRDR